MRWSEFEQEIAMAALLWFAAILFGPSWLLRCLLLLMTLAILVLAAVLKDVIDEKAQKANANKRVGTVVAGTQAHLAAIAALGDIAERAQDEVLAVHQATLQKSMMALLLAADFSPDGGESESVRNFLNKLETEGLAHLGRVTAAASEAMRAVVSRASRGDLT